MRINGTPTRTIWETDDGWAVEVIDQTCLPFEFKTARLKTWQDARDAIRDMWVRGAPLIGATAAYGLAMAVREDPSDDALEEAYAGLMESRPTAVNLRWALDDMRELIGPLSEGQRVGAGYLRAAQICDEDVVTCEAIGDYGLPLIEDAWKRLDKKRPVNVLTHCNAGWLATVDWGTATAPIYKAHDAGIPVHVWVDETRPRNQGARLTAWELGHHGVPHTVIADNAGGYLMQQGQVDLCITGTDRTAANGDVCNKIGTYLKALAAHDNGVPFYVALPGTTIDWTLENGGAIPIEERGAGEVTQISGTAEGGRVYEVRITPDGSPAANPAFDVTPAHLVSGLITERGVCPASAEGLRGLYPEH